MLETHADQFMGPRFEAWGSGRGGGRMSNRTVVDEVLPDMLHLIDPHWYHYPPLNELWHGIIGFVMVVMGSVSFIGNFMVLYIFIGTKSLRTPTNMYTINLAINDFLMMIVLCPMMVFGPLVCNLYAFAGSLFGCNSIWTMAMISFDRYNVIVKGLAGKPLTIGGALLRISFCWLHSLAWTVFPFFGWGRYVPEGNMTACGTDYLTKDWFQKSYVFVYGIFCYFIPLFVIIFSYFFIIKAVAAHEKAMREQAKKMNVTSLRSGDAAQTSAEIKLAKVALTTISLWFMAWTPYCVINYGALLDWIKISPLTSVWGSMFAKFSACYNPLVYGISHPKYRAEVHKKFPNCVCCGGPDENQGGGGGDTQSVATTVTDKNAA